MFASAELATHSSVVSTFLFYKYHGSASILHSRTRKCTTTATPSVDGLFQVVDAPSSFDVHSISQLIDAS